MMQNNPQEDQNLIRINAYLARAGVTTRKGADSLIESGRVFINGKKAKLGDKVSPTDHIEVSGIELDRTQYVYYAYNKPVGIVTTGAQGGEKDIVKTTKFPVKVFPVGRLDKDSHGLIIMTNDGRITDRLLNPEFPHEKEYVVRTDKDFNDAFLPKLMRGVKFDDYTTKPCKAKRIDDDVFSIILTEGKKRQIRKMCQVFGRTVRDLKRIRVMNIKLDTLAEGMYRPIEKDELKKFLSLLELEK